MTPLLTISEQERLLKSNELFIEATDRVIRAQRDYDMFPGSKNYRASLRAAIRNLEAIAKHEKQFINNQQKQLF